MLPVVTVMFCVAAKQDQVLLHVAGLIYLPQTSLTFSGLIYLPLALGLIYFYITASDWSDVM